MKNIKGLIAVLLSLVMVLSMVSCDIFAPADDGVSAGSKEEWDAAWNALGGSNNFSVELKSTNEYFDGHDGIAYTYSLEKLTADKYYQFYHGGNSITEEYVARIDGVDHMFSRIGDEPWSERTLENTVTYNATSLALMAYKGVFDQLTYDELKGAYVGTNVTASIEKSGVVHTSTAHSLTLKIKDGKIASLEAVNDITKRTEDGSEPIVIGLSKSEVNFFDYGTTALTLPTVGTVVSADRPSGYIDQSGNGGNGGEGGGASSPDDQVVYDKTAVSADAWAAAFALLNDPTRLTAKEESVYTLLDSRDVVITGYKYIKVSEVYNYDNGRHLCIGDQVVSLNGIVYDKPTAGESGQMTDVSHYERYYEKLPNLGAVVDNYLAYYRVAPGDKWKTNSTKEIRLMAYAAEYENLLSLLTFDSSTGLYTGTNLTAGHPELGYGYTLDSVSVGFVGGKIHTIAITKSTSDRKIESVYTYTDYGSTTVTPPSADEIYSGFTAAEWESFFANASRDTVYSIQISEDTMYDDGSVVESSWLNYSRSGNILRISDSLQDIEFYELKDGVLFRYYIAENGDGKEVWLVEQCTDAPEYAPGIGGAGYWLCCFSDIYSQLKYDPTQNMYIGNDVTGKDRFGNDVVYAKFTMLAPERYDTTRIEYEITIYDSVGGELLGHSTCCIVYKAYADYEEIGIMLPEVYEK